MENITINITELTQSSTINIIEQPQEFSLSVSSTRGADGTGVPSGGITGQILSKKTDASFDTEWADENDAAVAGMNKEIQFNDNGVFGASADFKYDKDAKAVIIGADATLLPQNPLAIAGNIDNYLQINIRNKNSGINASSDYIATADNGNDTTNYVDLGINNSFYSNPDYSFAKPDDGYLIAEGGDLCLSSGSSNKEIHFFAGGTLDTDLKATITASGIVIPDGMSYKVGTFDIMDLIAEASSQLEEDALFANGAKIVIRTDLL